MSQNLERIIRFVAVAQNQSFSRAAEALNIDQPWLSRQIQQLEAQIGFSLFERTTRRVLLTEEGAALLESASKLAELADEVDRTIRRLQRDMSNELRIGLSHTSYWVNARNLVLGKFESSYPQASMDMVFGLTPALVGMLEKREVDIVVGSLTEANDAVDKMLINQGHPTLLIPAGHPLEGQAQIQMRELKGFRLATTDFGHNPVASSTLYGPFAEAGMQLRTVHEGTAAIPHFARTEGLLILNMEATQGESHLPEGFVEATLPDTTSYLQTWVYRLSGDDRRVVRQFWGIARDYELKVTDTNKAGN